MAGAAHAETLADAIALAYQSNPQLQAERASLRALDETYVQARSAYGPQVSFGLGYDYSSVQSARSSFLGGGIATTRSSAVLPTLSASQLLYNGGRTASSVSAAEADILAERERLRETEGQILLQVVDSYAGVLRDQELLTVRTEALAAFERGFTEAKARLVAGDATQTDVGQTQSQYASARADVSAAKGQLQVSRAAYRAVVGQEAGTLQPPDALPGLPASVDEAFDAADRDNPELNRTILADRAAQQRVREAKAQILPSVSARASFGYNGPGGSESNFYLPQYDRQVSGTVTLTQPLFTGGQVSSQIRQAVEQEAAARLGIEYARRTAVQSVSQYWNQAAAADEELSSAQEAVQGATVSTEGAAKEYQAGLRSTLEVLIERERLRDAQIVLAQIRYSAYVSQAALLTAMGRMEASRLSEAVPLYDPVKHFKRVRHAGEVPWVPVAEAIDKGIGYPTNRGRPIPAPAPAVVPTSLAPPTNPPTPAGAYALTGPTAPLPGTQPRNTPSRLDSAPDPAAPVPTARP